MHRPATSIKSRLPLAESDDVCFGANQVYPNSVSTDHAFAKIGQLCVQHLIDFCGRSVHTSCDGLGNLCFSRCTTQIRSIRIEAGAAGSNLRAWAGNKQSSSPGSAKLGHSRGASVQRPRWRLATSEHCSSMAPPPPLPSSGVFFRRVLALRLLQGQSTSGRHKTRRR